MLRYFKLAIKWISKQPVDLIFICVQVEVFRKRHLTSSFSPDVTFMSDCLQESQHPGVVPGGCGSRHVAHLVALQRQPHRHVGQHTGACSWCKCVWQCFFRKSPCRISHKFLPPWLLVCFHHDSLQGIRWATSWPPFKTVWRRNQGQDVMVINWLSHFWKVTDSKCNIYCLKSWDILR